MTRIKHEENDEPTHQRLLFDGTASLDETDEVHVPRVKGLLELLNLYFGKKSRPAGKK